MKHDTFNYNISETLGYKVYQDFVRAKPKGDSNSPSTVKRLHLFWDYRYRAGTYKARKAGISRPSVMMRYKNDRFRLYGEPESNKLFDKCKDILKGWKARSKAEMRSLMPLYQQWLKENRLTAKDNPFSYWNINVRKT